MPDELKKMCRRGRHIFVIRGVLKSGKPGLFSGGGFGGCFFSGSCFSSGGSFFSGLGGSDFGFLLGYGLGLGLILCLLVGETLFGGEFLSIGYRGAGSVNGGLFFLFPSIETTLSLSFVESAFLNTTLKVLHKEHTFLREDSANCVGGLSTNVYPIQSTFEIQSYCSRISVRIIGTYPFNKFTISWCPAIGDNNRIKRIVLATMTL